MKLAHFTLGLLALVSPVAAAWSKEGQYYIILFPHRTPCPLSQTPP